MSRPQPERFRRDGGATVYASPAWPFKGAGRRRLQNMAQSATDHWNKRNA
jgi:hypothetical protein